MDIEWKNGFTAEIYGSELEGGWRIVFRDEDENLIRDVETKHRPEGLADIWVKAYIEARDGDTNVLGDYADAMVRIAELEIELSALK